MNTIAVDASRRLARVALSGTLTVSDVSNHIADLRTAILRAGIENNYSIIIDLTACTIQTQQMVEAMRDHMALLPKSDAIAVIVGSTLMRLQVRRLFAQSYARIASTQGEALAWVLEGREPSSDMRAIGTSRSHDAPQATSRT